MTSSCCLTGWGGLGPAQCWDSHSPPTQDSGQWTLLSCSTALSVWPSLASEASAEEEEEEKAWVVWVRGQAGLVMLQPDWLVRLRWDWVRLRWDWDRQGRQSGQHTPQHPANTGAEAEPPRSSHHLQMSATKEIRTERDFSLRYFLNWVLQGAVVVVVDVMFCFPRDACSVSRRSPLWGFRARTGRALSSSDSVYVYHRHLWITWTSQTRPVIAAGGKIYLTILIVPVNPCRL